MHETTSKIYKTPMNIIDAVHNTSVLILNISHDVSLGNSSLFHSNSNRNSPGTLAQFDKTEAGKDMEGLVVMVGEAAST